MTASRRSARSAVDTSVVVAALLHEDQGIVRACRSQIEAAPAAVSHVLAEAYARLTTMPGSSRLSPALTQQVLADMFPKPPLVLSGEGCRRIVDLMAHLGIPGGAIYDCLIAEAARENRVTLVSLDRRAAKNYAAVGVDFVLL